MQVLLVHGMGRTALSMYRLARYLRRRGHDTQSVGYIAAFESFGGIVDRIRGRLSLLARLRRPYAVVGHSLGGLLVRAALAGNAFDPLPLHLIMLGTPNRSPRLARRYQRVWPYRWINGQSGQVLAQAGFFEQLPVPPVPYTVIAGTRGWRRRGGPFGAEANDGVVAVSETLVQGTDTAVELPVRHTFMMNDPTVREVIRRLLAEAERDG